MDTEVFYYSIKTNFFCLETFINICLSISLWVDLEILAICIREVETSHEKLKQF